MYVIMGVKKVDYVSKKTGRQVDGFSLWISYERKDVKGLACDNVFVSSDRISSAPQVGVLCDVYYNRFGSVESVVIDDDLKGGAD